MTTSQPVPKQQLRNPEFMKFEKLPKNSELAEKFELPDMRGFELTEMRMKDSSSPATPHL